jgi:hypothetical protein
MERFRILLRAFGSGADQLLIRQGEECLNMVQDTESRDGKVQIRFMVVQAMTAERETVR